MGILLEGYSLVFQIEAVDQKYPGGTHGLVYNWDNGSWCSDGIIGRLSYYEQEDAICSHVALADQGLESGTTCAEDMALFLHGGHPWAHCLWADIKKTSSGLVYCNHVADKTEQVFLPKYFRHEWSLANYASEDQTIVARDVVPLTRSVRGAIYRDERLDKTFRGPGFLNRH